MGFKTDSSFLRFLTMGAIGVRQTMSWLRANGFEPIELERYCASNKIWMTKVKRLRLPDLLCVKTGLRLEVRAKSDLKIRMSDAPANPERTWDAGLRDDDVVALIAVGEERGTLRPADDPVIFTVKALRKSVATSKLGPPKSASEGAERDRTWPAVVPNRAGVVKSASAAKLVVEFGGDGNPARSQTFTLNGRKPYVKPGDAFVAEASILAGTPDSLADLRPYRSRSYDPIADLKSANAVDRYAAVKAIPYRQDLEKRAVAALEAILAKEPEERVALEAAGSAAAMGSKLGQERIEATLKGDGRADLRMEAVLILSELGSSYSRRELVRVATDARFKGNEIRQAAVWGLGKKGLKSYSDLLQFIADADENVAMHAIVGLGDDASADVVEDLVRLLASEDVRKAAAASQALRQVGSAAAVGSLVRAAKNGSEWIVATLGRLPPDTVRKAVAGTDLAGRVEPLLLLNERTNWLSSEDRVMDLAFLDKQNI